jgi:hypothetical protein
MPNGGNNRAPLLDNAVAGRTTYRFGRPARGFLHVVVWYHNTPSVGSLGWHWSGGVSRRARRWSTNKQGGGAHPLTLGNLSQTVTSQQRPGSTPPGSTCRRIRDWTSDAQQDHQGCHRRSTRQKGTHRQWHPGWAASPPHPRTQLSVKGHPLEPTWTHRQTPHHLCDPQRRAQRSGCPQSQTCHRGRYLQRDPR